MSDADQLSETVRYKFQLRESLLDDAQGFFVSVNPGDGAFVDGTTETKLQLEAGIGPVAAGIPRLNAVFGVVHSKGKTDATIDVHGLTFVRDVFGPVKPGSRLFRRLVAPSGAEARTTAFPVFVVADTAIDAFLQLDRPTNYLANVAGAPLDGICEVGQFIDGDSSAVPIEVERLNADFYGSSIAAIKVTPALGDAEKVIERNRRAGMIKFYLNPVFVGPDDSYLV